MLRPARRLTAAVGFAVVLAISTPALANAQGSTHTAVAPHHVGPAITPAQPFPSASSTVVGSVGFINADEVGYFWSASRGDSVAQPFSGPATIHKIILKQDVVQNVLSGGNTVDWTVSINGVDVGSFQVLTGQLGPFKVKYRFHKMTGGTYDVKMRVTNEVPSGGGSHTLRYAGVGPHSVKFK